MKPWSPEADAALAKAITQGLRLGVVARMCGRNIQAVTARAVERGLARLEDLDAVELSRLPWPSEWTGLVDRDLCSAQAAQCRALWADVFRFTVIEEIDEVRRARPSDPIHTFLNGYVSHPSARDVLDLAGLDADLVLPGLRAVAISDGLIALRRRLAGFDLRKDSRDGLSGSGSL